jgi:hypothetical protein
LLDFGFLDIGISSENESRLIQALFILPDKAAAELKPGDAITVGCASPTTCWLI